MFFVSKSKYFEVVVSCDPTFQDSIHHECISLKLKIEDTLKEASSRMNYNSSMGTTSLPLTVVHMKEKIILEWWMVQTQFQRL